jgi:hypothetical protein
MLRESKNVLSRLTMPAQESPTISTLSTGRRSDFGASADSARVTAFGGRQNGSDARNRRRIRCLHRNCQAGAARKLPGGAGGTIGFDREDGRRASDVCRSKRSRRSRTDEGCRSRDRITHPWRRRSRRCAGPRAGSKAKDAGAARRCGGFRFDTELAIAVGYAEARKSIAPDHDDRNAKPGCRASSVQPSSRRNQTARIRSLRGADRAGRSPATGGRQRCRPPFSFWRVSVVT